MRWLSVACVLPLAVACDRTDQVVPLLASAGVPLPQPPTVPLRVVTRSTAVSDPLRLRGTSIAYSDVEGALGHAIASATVPWADAHRSGANGHDGWQLFVEVTSADADYDSGRVLFTVGVRATLSARSGGVYLAQTQASCRQGATLPPDRAGPIVLRCMTELGRDLEGWLEGVDLDAVATSQVR